MQKRGTKQYGFNQFLDKLCIFMNPHIWIIFSLLIIYYSKYIYIYTHTHTYICMYVCVYIHIYTHTHTHIHIYIYIYHLPTVVIKFPNIYKIGAVKLEKLKRLKHEQSWQTKFSIKLLG